MQYTTSLRRVTAKWKARCKESSVTYTWLTTQKGPPEDTGSALSCYWTSSIIGIWNPCYHGGHQAESRSVPKANSCSVPHLSQKETSGVLAQSRLRRSEAFKARWEPLTGTVENCSHEVETEWLWDWGKRYFLRRRFVGGERGVLRTLGLNVSALVGGERCHRCRPKCGDLVSSSGLTRAVVL